MIIPPSESDILLKEMGFNLTGEIIEVLSKVNFNYRRPLFETATGGGRTAAVLSRLNLRTISGDNSLEKLPDAVNRIGNEHLKNITFIRMDMEKLPFRDNSFGNVVCVNTVHELKSPELCLGELIRVNSAEGLIIIGDFNKAGFDAMDKVHMNQFGRLHGRGTISFDRIIEMIRENYKNTEIIETPLNFWITGTGKKD